MSGHIVVGWTNSAEGDARLRFDMAAHAKLQRNPPPVGAIQ